MTQGGTALPPGSKGDLPMACLWVQDRQHEGQQGQQRQLCGGELHNVVGQATWHDWSRQASEDVAEGQGSWLGWSTLEPSQWPSVAHSFMP